MLLTCFAVFQELKLMTWSISLFILIQMLNYPFQRRTFLPLIGKGRFYSHLEKISLMACLFNKNLQTFVGWEISYEKIIPFNKRQGICSKVSRSWIIDIFFWEFKITVILEIGICIAYNISSIFATFIKYQVPRIA